MKTTLKNHSGSLALLLGAALLAATPIISQASPDATMLADAPSAMPEPGVTQHARPNGTGFYISVGLGGSYDPSTHVSIPNAVQGNVNGGGQATEPVTSKSSLEGGFTEFKLGYDWSVPSVDPNWIVGTELELDGGGSFFDGKISSPTTTADGKTFSSPLNGKTLYDGLADGLGFISARTGYNIGPVRPYIGAGFGGGIFATYSGSIKDDSGDKKAKIGVSETEAPAYRAFGGLNYFLDPQWSLNLEYSYQATTSSIVVAKGQTGENNLGTIRQHQLLLGFTYYP